MKIVIDMQGMQTTSRVRGIGRYTEFWIKALLEKQSNHEIILVFNGLLSDSINPAKEKFSKYLPKENFKTWYAHGPVIDIKNNQWRKKSAEFIREAFLYSLKPDVVILSTFFEGTHSDSIICINDNEFSVPTIAIFYDLIPLLFPDTYLKEPQTKKEYLQKVDNFNKVDFLFSISESSKKESVKHLRFTEEKVINISSDVDPIFRPISVNNKEKSILFNKFNLKKDFIMYSSATDERKNHLALIKAYTMLPNQLKRTHQLVLVGKLPIGHYNKFMAYAKKQGLKTTDIIITGSVTDNEMLQFYNLCKIFIFPSLYEGFGLPVLEAMRCNAVVIASNTSSLPEVVGNKAALFNPHDTQSITNKLKEVLTDTNLYQKLKLHAAIQSQKFNSKTTANIICNALEEDLPISDIHINKNINIQASLLKHISLIKEDVTNDDLINTAYCITKTFPNSNLPQQLFLDISELVYKNNNTNKQKIIKNILKELLNNQPENYKVMPIYCRNDEHRYKYAQNFTKKNFKHKIKETEIDEIIEIKPNDIFLILDISADTQAIQKLYYKELNQYGIKTYFLVHDMYNSQDILNNLIFTDSINSTTYINLIEIFNQNKIKERI